MDIACVVRRSFPGPGGIAMMLRSITRELAKAHHVRVWAARIDDAPITRLNATLGAQVFSPQWVDGVEVRPVPMNLGALAASTPMALMTVPGLRSKGYQVLRRATAPGFVRSVAARLAAEWDGVEVVHAWGGEHLNWAAGHAARRSGRPLVVTPFAHPDAWGDDPLNVRFYRTAHIVCALLPSEAAFYARLGVDEAKLRVVGVPVSHQPPPDPTVQTGEGPLVLYLGVKEPYKGYRTLLQAAPLVWREVPDARFAFVGPRTEESIQDFAVMDDQRIIEVGRVPDEQVVAWQQACTVFCLPSTSEIMPVSILEAWHHRKPVVAARWWCANDLIDDGTDGAVVDGDGEQVARALIALLRDEAAARAMGEAGRAKVEQRYTPEAVTARHLAAYEAALG